MAIQQLPRIISKSLSLSAALEEFNLHQRVSRHSPKTLLHYAHSFGKFRAWLESEGVTDVAAIEGRHIRAFMLSLEGSLKPSTLHGVMRDVRALFNFLEREELIVANPMRRVKMPKLDKTIMPAFSAEDVAKLERATEGKTARELRNRALVFLLLDTGLRLTECAALRVGDVDPVTGLAKVMGKGRKERIVRLGTGAMRAYLRYVRVRGGMPGEPLWLGKRGPMTAAGIAETLEKLGKSCGVHAHPHKFRRTCALFMLRSGADVFSVQHLLGHSDLAVLRRYLAQTEADVTRAHERHSPVDGLR